MRAARLQTNDLGRADHFFATLLSKENVKEAEKASAVEASKPPQTNGGSLSLRTDAKNRFSDPPAPPPQQPLPEKPDVTRSSPSDPCPPPLKRGNTERSRSGTSTSPTSEESTSQIVSLVEELASARKEIDSQSARMRDLEEMLQKERRARELAEELAKQLEQQSSHAMINGNGEGSSEGSIIEEAFEPPADKAETNPTARGRRAKSPLPNSEPRTNETIQPSSPTSKAVDTKSISTYTSLLEQRMETMLVEMQQLREHLESFKKRAETAESDRDLDRKTLAEMVEKIRSDEPARRSSSTERARSPATSLTPNLSSSSSGVLTNALDPLLQKTGLANGNSSARKIESGRMAAGALSIPPAGQNRSLYHTTPYASMLGVVLIGMGLMAYLNAWQPPKTD
jgi:hypothetical protein